MNASDDTFAGDRRRFCVMLAAPLCAAACSTPSSPTVIAAPPPAAPSATVTTPLPPTPVEQVTPHGPNGPLTIVASVVSGSELRVAIEGTPLTTIGGVARATGEVRGLHRFLLLTRISDESMAVLNGTCTHEGCTVSQFVAPHFECPCHGSRFEWSGTLVRGPAAAALPRLDGRFDGRVITVSFP